MPGPLLAPIIAGGASLLGGFLNSSGQANENERSRRFALNMYNRQYADNIGLWNMQNQYNLPSAQMQRYKDAGLNPNLIYGQTNTAGSLSAPTPQTPQFQNPRFGDAIQNTAVSSLEQMYNLEMKAAQVDNAKAQNNVLINEALEKVARIADTRATTARRTFDLDFESELRSTSADARRELLRQTQIQNNLSVRKDIRETISSATSYTEAVERVKNLAEQRLTMQIGRAKTEQEIQNLKADRARILKQIELMKKEGVIKQLDADLAKQKIRPGDPLWSRWMTQGFDSIWNFLFE